MELINLTHWDEYYRCSKIAPTIILDVQRDCVIMEDEIFGPLLPILTVKLNYLLPHFRMTIQLIIYISSLLLMKVNKIEECFSLICGKEKPLAAYLFTNDTRLKKEFVRNVSAGGIIINDTILHVSTLDFLFNFEIN